MEEIDENNIKLSSKQINELVDLLEKEAVIESESHKAQDQSTSGGDKSTSGRRNKEKLKIPLPENAQAIPAASKDVPKTNTKSKTL